MRYLQLLPLVWLAACGGGGDSASPTTPGPGSTPVVPAPTPIRGALTKGPVANATIEVFVFDNAGQAVGDPVASTQTDGAGQFSLASVPRNEPYLVVSSGGVFTDESDKFRERQVTLGATEGLESILPAGAQTVAINPYTQALVDKTRDEAGANSFLSLLGSNQALFASAFGFDVLTALPGDPVQPQGGTNPVNYAMTLGGGANAIAAITAGTGGDSLSFAAIRAFSADFSDGQLDGARRGNALSVNGQAVPPVDINAEIERFRNNNDEAYLGLPPVRINLGPLTQVATPDPGANRAPVGADDSYSVDEGRTLNVPAPGVLDNDTDPDGDALNATLDTAPAQATSFNLNPDGSFDYSHDGSENLSDTFSYRVGDAGTDAGPVTVTITLNPIDDAPIIDTNEALAVVAGGSATLSPAQLSASDPDSDDATISFSQATAANCGEFQRSAVGISSFSQQEISDGLISYAATGCVGGESLDIGLQASNGGPSTDFTFTVTVSEPPNQPPVATGDSYALDEGATLNLPAPGVLGNDSDPDGDPLAATLEDEPLEAANFSLNADGSFSYTHDGGETTTDSFSYFVSDGAEDSAVVSVSLSINPVDDAPVLERNNGASVPPGGSRAIGNNELQASDVDTATTALSFSVLSPPSCGEFLLSGSPGSAFSQDNLDAGRVSYNGSSCAPDQSFDVSMQLADASSSVAFNFSITVPGSTNQPPVNGLPDSPVSALIRGATPISGLSVFDPDADPALDALTVTLSVGRGTLSLRTDVPGGVTAAQLSGNTSGSITITAPQDPINTTLAQADALIYSVASTQRGSDTLTMFSDDGGANGSGGAQSDSDNLTIFLHRLAVANLDGSTGTRLNGNEDGGRAGRRLSTTLGDINGDGLVDFVIGSRDSDSVHVHLGRGGAYPASASLGNLQTADAAYPDGFVLEHDDDDAKFGEAIALGDFNGDGIDDVAVGATLTEFNGISSGSVFVFFGRSPAPQGQVSLDFPDGTNSLRIDGAAARTRLGNALSFGDVNGDGIDDLLIGFAANSSGTNEREGGGVLVYGTDQGFPPVLDTLDIDGSNGIRIDGAEADGQAGAALALGDITGDGLAEAVLGAPLIDAQGQPNSGRVYVLLASTLNQGQASFQLADVNGSNGFIIESGVAGALLGSAVAIPGDLNGDGTADLAVSAPTTQAGGSVYVVNGTAAPALSVDPTTLNGINGFTIVNTSPGNAALGVSLAGRGDALNGDGLADLLIGDPNANNALGLRSGLAYVVAGAAGTRPAVLDLATVDGDAALWIEGESDNDELGWALVSGGDMNADAQADLVVSAQKSGFMNRGSVYLLLEF